MCFWLVIKLLSFLLIYDKINSKEWLLNILKFPDLHYHGIDWKTEWIN